MKQNRWKFLGLALLVAWALWEIYPPWDQSLIETFNREAQATDQAFQEIVSEARQLQQEYPEQEFQNLLEAIGEQEIAGYFPQFDVPPEKQETQEINRHILYQLQRKASGSIQLGLDLKGGVSFLVDVDMSKTAGEEDESEIPGYQREAVLGQAISVLRQRVDNFGVSEPMIRPVGESQILIQLPGLSQAEKEDAREQIQKTAHLEFRLVHPESSQLIREGIVPPGYERLTLVRESQGQQEKLAYLVKKEPERGLTGKYLTSARAQPHNVTRAYQILLSFDSEGSELFYQVTREHQGEQLAIVLDGQLYSAPSLNEPIPGGRAQISGDFSRREAQNLASVLTNPLEAPVEILEERSVDPTLGEDSIRSGIVACIIGLALVSVFMLGYYFLAGVVANVALLLNMLLLLAVLASVEATLTLPGIAGIILTVGMAVDANVLIFERIREELRAGKSLRGAITAGYDKAFSTIFDANVTTLIASVILVFLGKGPVKGFGVTLTIGICASMFTALVVTRLIFDWFWEKGWLKSIHMLRLLRDTRINFMRWWKPAFAVSWVVILIGVLGGSVRGQEIFGVDFAGGDSITLDFKEKVPVGDLREALGEMGYEGALIQYQTDLADGSETLRLTTPFETSDEVIPALQERFPDAGFSVLLTEAVGATVGKQVQQSAFLAVFLALFGVLVYVAFRFEVSFAIAAVVAVLHDALMTMGIFVLLGGQFSAPMVAAVLTIIGFSLNDTIVIFDRIRENLELGMRGSFTDLMNHALNRTLARTIITSGTTLLATLALYIFGGVVIHDFALTFLIGVIVGTYSSIYIASAFVLWWHRGERPLPPSEIAVEERAQSPAAA